jgi:hypothetical protein
MATTSPQSIHLVVGIKTALGKFFNCVCELLSRGKYLKINIVAGEI